MGLDFNIVWAAIVLAVIGLVAFKLGSQRASNSASEQLHTIGVALTGLELTLRNEYGVETPAGVFEDDGTEVTHLVLSKLAENRIANLRSKLM